MDGTFLLPLAYPASYISRRAPRLRPVLRESRARQRRDVRGPLFLDLGQVVIARPGDAGSGRGLDDPSLDARTDRSGRVANVPGPCQGLVPESIRRKLSGSLNGTVAELVQRGIIGSGEVLARVLPQLTAGPAGIADPSATSVVRGADLPRVQDAVLRRLAARSRETGADPEELPSG